MLQLRDYQRAAITAVYDYWRDNDGSPLIVIPTGGGKSLIIATFMQELLANYPDMRVLCVTHVKELLTQNFKELVGIWPFAPAGLYSAGLGKRDAHSQIIFGGVQTIANKAAQIGHIDLVLVDEAHLVPRKAETQYGQLLAGLRAINPDLKLLGLTATPYRMGEGQLHEGDGAMFDAIAYEKPIIELIDDGYLCRPISKGTATTFDVSGVAKSGGDYKQGALQAAVDKRELTQDVVDELMRYGQDRRAWLVFCSGVEHAFNMRDEIRSRGISCETVTGATPSGERARILADFKAGHIRAVTNQSVMTTGTNIPRIDLVAFCRPTLSAGLYLQMAGRGLRTSPGKDNCLFLDFAGVVRKHGPIDAVTPPRAKGEGAGEAPIRLCPQCQSINHASARVCVDCGFEFPEPESKVKATADDVPILSKDEATWRTVNNRTFRFHEGKGDKPPTVKITYLSGMTAINEWMCPEHHGYPKSKADRWWLAHGGQRPFPRTVLEWLERQRELAATAEIAVTPNGRYWDVVDYRVGTATTEPAPDNDNLPAAWAELDDAIPF